MTCLQCGSCCRVISLDHSLDDLAALAAAEEQRLNEQPFHPHREDVLRLTKDVAFIRRHFAPTSYEVARSTQKDMSSDCAMHTTSGHSWSDPSNPAVGGYYYYLVRPLTPNVGSWGQMLETASFVPRGLVCP